MELKKLILIGGGGHCNACIDVINEIKEYNIQGILEREKSTEIINSVPIIGTDDEIDHLATSGNHFLITVGQLKNNDIRVRIFKKLSDIKAPIATVISNHSYVSESAGIGSGTIVMHYSLINASVVIGNNCIINTKSLVEHDCNIGNHTHISTGAIINGTCNIGSNCFVGSGVVVKNNITITDNVILGAGAIVTKNIEQPGTYIGAPATKISDE